MMHKNLQKNKGYTLLFAVLVSSVVLAIGISILTISKKEFLLSSSARESTSAFYAADSGLECAILYGSNFSTSTPESASIDCVAQQLSYGNGIAYDESPTEGDVKQDEERFTFDIKTPGATACASVRVRLYYEQDDELGYIPRTTIESRGYNIGWSGTSCSQASPRRVERALQYTF